MCRRAEQEQPIDEYHVHYDLIEMPPAESGGVGSKRRRKMWEKDPHCYYCGKELSFEESSIDHVVPRSKGGSNRDENLVLSCQPCNHDKGDMDQEEFLKQQRE